MTICYLLPRAARLLLCPARILPQEHIMVIRQYVCIGINQRESHHKSYDTAKSVCNF